MPYNLPGVAFLPPFDPLCFLPMADFLGCGAPPERLACLCLRLVSSFSLRSFLSLLATLALSLGGCFASLRASFLRSRPSCLARCRCRHCSWWLQGH